MGKDHHTHHAPVIANEVKQRQLLSSSSRSALPMSSDEIPASDDDESACRGYSTITTKNNDNNSDNKDATVNNNNNNLNHDTTSTSITTTPADGGITPSLGNHDDINSLATSSVSIVPSHHEATAEEERHYATGLNTGNGHGHANDAPTATTAKLSRVASPVLSRDFAALEKPVSNESVTSNAAAGRPSILRNGGNTAQAQTTVTAGKHGKHHHKHSDKRGRQTTTAAPAIAVNTAIPVQDAATTNGNATNTGNRVNFSPLANPRINKALKSLVRSSSEPGMSRSGNNKPVSTGSAVVGVGAQLATVGAGQAGTPLSPVTSANEKHTSEEDEKAGLQGSKVFTVGSHDTLSKPTATGGNKINGQLPLARSSEPYLPTSHSLGHGLFDDPEDNITVTVNPAYPPPNVGSAPGVQGASGGAGAPTLTFEGLLEPEKPLRPPPTWKTSMWNIIKYSWLNVLLVFIPVSFACHFSGVNDTATFCVSFAAIIPLAALLGFATEELALRVGHTLGGLLNATFGNTIELIIAILALVKGELRVVQAAMIGSILSNCLLVLGCCFFAGGIRFHEQVYTIRSAQLNISLLGISALVIVIPAAFNAAVTQLGSVPVSVSDRDILQLSRGVAFILLFVYAAYLFFQFWTHSYLYRATVQHHRSIRARSIILDDEPQPPMDSTVLRIPTWHSSSSSGSSSSDDSSSTHSRERDVEAEGESRAAVASASNGGSSPGTTGTEEEEHLGGMTGKGGHSVQMSRTRSNGTTNASSSSSSSSSSNSSDDEDSETPQLKVQAALVLILVVTAITGVTAEWLVDSIDGVTESGNISREFVALILLPLVGNVAEHVTAVTVSVKDKLDLSMAVAVGSSIQISLFVIPILVILGWCIGQPLTLEFDILETIILFISIVIVNQAISDGKTNWMEGAVLISTYITIALAMWFYPGGGGL